MSSLKTIKAQISALLESANATTGNADTNLTDGVNALIDGYGKVTVKGAYAELKYIESTGKQYIDTLVNGGYTSAYEISFNPLQLRVAYEHYFGGSTPTSNPIAPKVYQDDGGVGAQNAKDSFVKLSSLNTDIVVKYKEDGTVYCNGVLKGTLPPSGWGDMTWFVCNSPSGNDKASTMRLYYLKMWRDGELVRDFIPALDETFTPCLYDKVTETYFYNKGDGSFIGVV